MSHLVTKCSFRHNPTWTSNKKLSFIQVVNLGLIGNEIQLNNAVILWKPVNMQSLGIGEQLQRCSSMSAVVAFFLFYQTFLFTYFFVYQAYCFIKLFVYQTFLLIRLYYLQNFFVYLTFLLQNFFVYTNFCFCNSPVLSIKH